MKFKQFFKKRWELYLVIGVFCFFLYLLKSDNTVLGIIIGLVVSEIDRYFGFTEQLRADEAAKSKSAEKDADKVTVEIVDEKAERARKAAEKRRLKSLMWKKIALYTAVVLLIWVLANIYLTITNK
jgi:hypothetical protein